MELTDLLKKIRQYISDPAYKTEDFLSVFEQLYPANWKYLH